MRARPWFPGAVVFAALLGCAPTAPAQVAPAVERANVSSLARRIDSIVDQAPLDRAHWGIEVWDPASRQVSGALVADQSAWDTVHVHGDWSNYDLLWWYAAPTGALGFNDNSVDFQVRPGRAVGDPARISAAPQTSGDTFDNRTNASGLLSSRVKAAIDDVVKTIATGDS